MFTRGAIPQSIRLREGPDAAAQGVSDGVGTFRVQTIAVDGGSLADEAENAGFWVAFLGLGGDAADLDEAGAGGEEGVRELGVLV